MLKVVYNNVLILRKPTLKHSEFMGHDGGKLLLTGERDRGRERERERHET